MEQVDQADELVLGSDQFPLPAPIQENLDTLMPIVTRATTETIHQLMLHKWSPSQLTDLIYVLFHLGLDDKYLVPFYYMLTDP